MKRKVRRLQYGNKALTLPFSGTTKHMPKSIIVQWNMVLRGAVKSGVG